MEEVKITRNYQITIPAYIGDKLGIKIRDRIPVYMDKDRIIMEKPEGDIAKISIKLEKNIDAESVKRVIRGTGDEIGRSGL